MKIVLLGYMGCGKSSIADKLSHVLKYEHIDLDTFIEKKEGALIADIFKNRGEVYFRTLESRYLKEVLQIDNSVIALGGGTPCYGDNMDIILNTESSYSAYLKASIPTLVKRLSLEKAKRPLISHLKSDAELTEFVGKHLFERSFYYNQAQIVQNIDEKSVDVITTELVAQLF